LTASARENPLTNTKKP